MTAEASECNGGVVIVEGPEGEVEGKGCADLSPRRDPASTGGKCNCIAPENAGETEREPKDEGDNSYVFVDGRSDGGADRDGDPIDPVEDLGRKPIEGGDPEPELGTGDSNAARFAESEGGRKESGEEKGLGAEGSGIPIPAGVDSEHLSVEKTMDGENFSPTAGDLCEEPSNDGLEANGVDRVQEQLELDVDVRGNRESQIREIDIVELTSSSVDEGSEQGTLAGAGDVGENGLCGGLSKSDADVNSVVKDQQKLELMVGVEQNQESESRLMECVGPENKLELSLVAGDVREIVGVGNSLGDADSHEEPSKDCDDANNVGEVQEMVELTVAIEENQKPESGLVEAVESESPSLDNGIELGSSNATSDVKEIDQCIVSVSVDPSCNEPSKHDVVAADVVDGEEKLELTAEVLENQESQIGVGDCIESESRSLEIGNKSGTSNMGDECDICVSIDDSCHVDATSEIDGQGKVESISIAVEDQEFQIVVVEGGKSDSCYLEKENEPASSTLGNEVPVEEPSLELETEQELKPETAIPVGDMNSVKEVGDEPAGVDHAELHTEAKPSSVASTELKKVGDGRAGVVHAELHTEATPSSVTSTELEVGVRDVSDDAGRVVGGEMHVPAEVLAPDVRPTLVSAESGEVNELDSVGNSELESPGAQPVPETSEDNAAVCSDCGSEPISVIVKVSIANGRELAPSPANGKMAEDVQISFVRTDEGLPIHEADDLKSETFDENGCVENGDDLHGCPANQKLEIEVEKDGPFASGEAKSNVSVKPSEILLTCPDASKLAAKATDDHSEYGENQPASVGDSSAKVEEDNVESGCEVPPCPVNADSEANVGKEDVKSENDMINDFSESSGSASDCVTNVVAIENEDPPTTRDDDNRSANEDAVGVERMPTDEIVESSTADDTHLSNKAEAGAELGDAELGKKLPMYIIRIPRFFDDDLVSQIKTAQLRVDEKTQQRDSIRSTVQQTRTKCGEHREKFEAAKQEERAARDAVVSKRQEIDSIQFVINRMKNANSIDEIEERIHNMEHTIEHVTMPLKEEKQLIREIKQLKQVREQLCATAGTQAEIEEAFNQKDSIDERFKVLKQELDSLKNVVLKTESITKSARKKYLDECEKLRELQAQFKAADDLRQGEYSQLQELKKRLYEKNKYFRMYKEDEKIAADFVSHKEIRALQSHCNNQVVKIMELWNKNDEFRRDYVRCNKMSTLRRLRTLDGRALGPDEKPPVLRNTREERTDVAQLATAERSIPLVVSALEIKQENVTMHVVSEESISKREVGQKNTSSKSKKATKSTIETVSAAVVVEETTEEKKRMKEEEEKARKAEEFAREEEERRREEDAAKLKEQRRLEEKAKAKEAEERKRRNAEKAKARAELKAQKDAEQREKEREKRFRKKERKKAAAAGTANGCAEGVDLEVSENRQPEAAQEPENEKPVAVTKRPTRSMPVTKQTKIKPLPPPLRNRSKRRMQSWMWVVVASVSVLALFLVAMNTSSLNINFSSFGI